VDAFIFHGNGLFLCTSAIRPMGSIIFIESPIIVKEIDSNVIKWS